MPFCRSPSSTRDPLDSTKLALFQADINAQLDTIERVFALVQARAEDLSPNNPEKLESLAYQIHNFYSATEDLLKLVATYFEDNISDSSQWHSLLLKRMMQSIEGVRPPVLSWETYEKLNSLRAFRHFFRHAYGVTLDFSQLKTNLEKTLEVKPILNQEISRFLILLKEE